MPLFTVEEARAFEYQGEKQLADAAKYPDELIEATAERIAQRFARICGVSFLPITSEEVIDGAGYDVLALPDERVIGVGAVERWDGDTWVAAEDGYRLIPGGLLIYNARHWPRGKANLRVTYTHGYEEVPLPIKRAALILAVNDLRSSNVSDRATQQTNDFGTYNLAVPGWREGQSLGLPIVDSTLADYSERRPRVG